MGASLSRSRTARRKCTRLPGRPTRGTFILPRARRGPRICRRPIRRIGRRGRVSRVRARRCHRAGGDLPPGAVKPIAQTPWRVKQMEASPDGKTLAFAHRFHLRAAGRHGGLWHLPGGCGRRASRASWCRSPAVLDSMHWTPDGRHIFFSFLNGSVEGNYQDAQPRVYWVDAVDSGRAVTRWSKFPGAVTGYAVTQEGGLLVTGRMGTEVQVYRERRACSWSSRASTGRMNTSRRRRARRGWPLCIRRLPSRRRSFWATAWRDAKPITAVQPACWTERELPRGQPYTLDGRTMG